MKIVDVWWTPTFNYLRIQCDCGATLDHETRASMAQCPACGRAELWHAVAPRPETGMWSEPVMEGLSA